MKGMDNRGFSLMELIITIAIMAVLMSVLTPQLLRYVESSRIQKDETFLSEVESAVKVACASMDVYDALPSGDVYATVTIDEGSPVTSDITPLEEELHRIIPDSVDFVSKKYEAAGAQTVHVSIDTYRKIVIVTNSWEAAPAP